MIGSHVNSAQDDLGRYVSHVMSSKGLSARDVADASGGRITRAYVTAICKGTAKRLSLDRILGLAQGLGVDRYEVFSISCGPPELPSAGRGADEILQPSELLELINGQRVGPWLRAIVQSAAQLEPNELEAVLLTLYRLISAKEDRGKGQRR
ncbi:MAG TPA: helix-turn-helix transcriptional regulator [Blastocatellia bacterium]|nr:helix-turn-helix transcriptional regulator [Blastocatellia bacterium]